MYNHHQTSIGSGAFILNSNVLDANTLDFQAFAAILKDIQWTEWNPFFGKGTFSFVDNQTFQFSQSNMQNNNTLFVHNLLLKFPICAKYSDVFLQGIYTFAFVVNGSNNLTFFFELQQNENYNFVVPIHLTDNSVVKRYVTAFTYGLANSLDQNEFKSLTGSDDDDLVLVEHFFWNWKDSPLIEDDSINISAGSAQKHHIAATETITGVASNQAGFNVAFNSVLFVIRPQLNSCIATNNQNTTWIIKSQEAINNANATQLKEFLTRQIVTFQPLTSSNITLQDNAFFTFNFKVVIALVETDFDMRLGYKQYTIVQASSKSNHWAKQLGFDSLGYYTIHPSDTNNNIGVVVADNITQLQQLNLLHPESIILTPVQKGVKHDESGGEGRISINISTGYYTRATLLSFINESFSKNDIWKSESPSVNVKLISEYFKNTTIVTEYIQFTFTALKTYTHADFDVVFYNQADFSLCFSGTDTDIAAANFALNKTSASREGTLGWTLGFRQFQYTLDTFIVASNNVLLVPYTYMLLVLEEHVQGRLNDGIVAIAPDSANTIDTVKNPLRKRQQSDCFNTNNNDSIGIGAESTSKGAHFIQDVFAFLQLKTNGPVYYGNDGGSLLLQERKYTGPVNIGKFSVKLVSDRGDVINYASDWNFTLIADVLLQPGQFAK